MVKVLSISHKLRLKQTAYSVLSEELTYLRSRPYAEITNVSNADFRGILYHKGKFVVTADQSVSGSQSIHVSQGTTSDANTISALTTPPVGAIAADASYSASVFVPSTNSADWQIALPFRAIDENNMYILRMDNNSIDFIVYADGVPTTLLTTTQTVATDTWHTLAITASADSFQFTYDGSPLSASAIVNNTYSKGSVGFATYGTTDAYVDNVTLQTNLDTYLWNFDSADDYVSRQAAGWKRSGLYDLPSAAASLTISDEQADAKSPLKNILVTVSWNDGIASTASIETYVAQTGISK